jgi:hypothetical protein
MATTPVPSQHNVMTEFDDSIERALGADMRLIYGLAVPLFMVIGLIVLLALNPTTWLVIGIVLLEVAALGLIVYGLMNMMRDDQEERGG